MKRDVIFVFGGEGAHSEKTDMEVVRESPVYGEVMKGLAEMGVSEKSVLGALGVHDSPLSTIATTVINVCLCEAWRAWGYEPTIATGHSVGELAAAYASGMYTIKQTLEVAKELGELGASLEGGMVHTTVKKSEVPGLRNTTTTTKLALAAINAEYDDFAAVTLCGPTEAVEERVATDANAAKLKVGRPWHHPKYAGTRMNKPVVASRPSKCDFVSATTGERVLDTIGADHWASWLKSPVEFASALEALPKEEVVVEIGPHPTFAESLAHHARPEVMASSMRRGEKSVEFALAQRRSLPEGPRRAAIAKVVPLVWDVPFGDQGLRSIDYPRVAASLRTFFPGLEAHHLFRFSSLEALDREYPDGHSNPLIATKSGVDLCWHVVGVSVELEGVRDLDSLRAALAKSGRSALDLDELRSEAASLFGSKAEAEAASPQHALALLLARRAVDDFGKDLASLAPPERVGVYVGAWQQEEVGSGAYSALGCSLGSLPGQVAGLVDARGPCVGVNTACSSALVALDSSLADLRRGRVDAALVGAVNVLDRSWDAPLAKARFASPTDRCHTFSSEADGYARAEGGAFFLLLSSSSSSSSLCRPARTAIVGSAITQNARQRPLSAVDGRAQERCVRLAAADAGIDPSCLGAVECHGTGTPLGDPVEIDALRRAGFGGYVTASKRAFGHCEAAAGAVGLAVAVAFARGGSVLQPAVTSPNPAVARAAGGVVLLPGKSAAEHVLDKPYVGVSSFGFAGSNAHAIVKRLHTLRVEESEEESTTPLPLEEEEEEKNNSPRGVAANAAGNVVVTTDENDDEVEAAVWAALSRVVDVKGVAASDDLLDVVGVDSLGVAEVVASLEGSYGDDVVTVDSIFAEPTVEAIVARIKKAAAAAAATGVVVAAGAAKATADEVEAAVWAALSRVVDVKGVAASDDLLDVVGVDSLGVAEVVASLEGSYGDDVVTVDSIFAEPTVEAIVARIKKAIVPSAVEETTLETLGGGGGGERPPEEKNMKEAAPPSLRGVHGFEEEKKNKNGLGDDERKTTQPPPPLGDPWFEVTHVGSLPRDGLGDVVARQVACGVDVVNDGEWGRPNYVSELVARIDGLGDPEVGAFSRERSACACCVMPVAADLAEVPGLARRFDGSNGIISLNPARPARSNVACVGRPRRAVLDSRLDAEIGDLKRRAGGRKFFWSAPSPGTLACLCEDRYFNGNHEAYVMALAEAIKPEYEAISAAGAILSIDCPDLAMGRHTRWSGVKDDEEFVNKILAANVRALNSALEAVSGECRVHVCWGNYAGSHHRDIELSKIWGEVMKIEKVKVISVEAANPRHEWEIADIREDQVLAAGVVDTKTVVVEHPELVALRLLRLAKRFGPHRVSASTDCGFASTAKSTAIPAEIAWMKLRALGEGAALARRKLASVPVALRPVGFRAIVVSKDRPDLRAACFPWPCDVVAAAAPEEILKAARYVDFPLALVGPLEIVEKAAKELEEDGCFAVGFGPETPADEIVRAMTAPQRRDKLRLLGARRRQVKPPSEVDVVVVGAGLCGLTAARACQREGYEVVILERRFLAGGVWTSFANSSSQVNSSEGGYAPVVSSKKQKKNRDHTPTHEIVDDLARLVDEVGEDVLYFGCDAMRIVNNSLVVTRMVDHAGNGFSDATTILASKGVVVAINDRVGVPRPFDVENKSFRGCIRRGLWDDLADYDFRGRRVVIVGFGAFAVENARTALEHGAAKVTVVARRAGAVCPKAIDYLNFVKPFSNDYRHDPATNVKQLRQWQRLYEASGARPPDTWPAKIKPDGHTISVSDVWWIGHHLKKLETKIGRKIARMEEDGARLDDGDFVPCDLVVACVGFERNARACERLTGVDTVTDTNFLAPKLMYLADAEIDDGAFNFFFGSSVLEYAKFYSNVFAKALGDKALGEALWGPDVPTHPVDDRKWSHYIQAARRLIKAFPRVRDLARDQVDDRTLHFWNTFPPQSWLGTNKRDWHELHTRLNNGVPVDNELPYFFDDLPAWCGEDPRRGEE
ncbi:hypothetical protein CTAYLR_004322 [Chrysophaeum taylorii]|uniref:Polyketide synthase n=1 Tax=Chrysophaeum taylorii TaxID=2483200 RepID=A0AAD7UGE2_9STRA|nr:hypothetical protein CTAYLR_004322 [Chrysophaeum taylorii]